MICVLLRREEDADMQRGTPTWGHREEVAVYMPRREASGGASLATPRSQASSLQDWSMTTHMEVGFQIYVQGLRSVAHRMKLPEL